MYNILIKTEPSVAAVTDHYLHIIGDALVSLGHTVRYRSNWETEGCDLAVTATATGAARLRAAGIPYILWCQGIWPEESLLRHGSKLRYRVTGYLEKQALKHARFCFFVSTAMRLHYEKKYGLSFEGRCYIMPCSNEAFHPEAFLAPGKYDDLTFCYLGSTAVWQCFEETISLFARIKESHPEAKLLLLVQDRQRAMQTLEKFGVEAEIDFVPVEQLPQRLKTVRYGFLLRRDDIVNHVATPTKLATYLCSGVIPLYSGCIASASKIMGDTPYAFCYNEGDDPSALAETLTARTEAQEVQSSFATLYEQYYDPHSHTRRIAALFQTGLG